MDPSKTKATSILLAAAAVALCASSLTSQVQERRLTTPIAAFSESFSTISGLLELSTGQVMVADGLGQALVVLDMAAGTADTIGRTGPGPEEYRQPDGIFPLPGDSILLVDLGNGRLTALGPDFGFGQTWPIAQGQMGMMGGSMTMRLPRAVDSNGRVYVQGRMPMAPGRPMPDSAYMLRWDRNTNAVDTLGLVKEQEMTRTSSGGPSNQNVSIRPVPMSPQDGWTAGWDGSLAVVRAGGYYVEWIFPDGRVVTGPPNQVRTSRVRRDDKIAYMEQMQRNSLGVEVMNVNGNVTTAFRRGSRGGGAEEPNIDGLEWPDALPAFRAGGVLVPKSGEVWVERFVPAGSNPVYDVFDEAATLVRRIVLPADRSIVGFGDGCVYLARTDEFDLQWLEKYVLQ